MSQTSILLWICLMFATASVWRPSHSCSACQFHSPCARVRKLTDSHYGHQKPFNFWPLSANGNCTGCVNQRTRELIQDGTEAIRLANRPNSAENLQLRKSRLCIPPIASTPISLLDYMAGDSLEAFGRGPIVGRR